MQIRQAIRETIREAGDAIDSREIRDIEQLEDVIYNMFLGWDLFADDYLSFEDKVVAGLKKDNYREAIIEHTDFGVSE